MIVQLGNDRPLDRGEPITGPQITTVDVPDGWTTAEAARAISHPDGLWARHSASDTPVWIEAPGQPELAQALSEHYNNTPIGRPNGWEVQS